MKFEVKLNEFNCLKVIPSNLGYKHEIERELNSVSKSSTLKIISDSAIENFLKDMGATEVKKISLQQGYSICLEIDKKVYMSYIH